MNFNRNMDTCLAIRLAFKKGDKVFVQSGARIVVDSVHQKKYVECIDKAKAIMNALNIANRGLDGETD